MKIGKLFNLTTDVQDVLEFFEGVDNKDQLISRLERLRRSGQGADDLYTCLEGMRASLQDLLEDTLEMSASLDEKGDLDEDLLDREIQALENLNGDEETNLSEPDAEPEIKNNEPNAS